eukprot:TRINITY_DN18739_c0_g2_i1.p1 TRINITY_DN18739_c0_g2~~TRINITY_DN18739_c0_g2_i1.p1  ORF type:complete len:329 (-),score=85.50 TRINITY_DN18739_c0_g2_i1:49-1035(-)
MSLSQAPMAICGCMCCLAVIAVIVVVCTSFMTLPQGEYALTYNWVTQHVSDVPLTKPGMFCMPFVQLMRYPSTYQMMYFDTFNNGWTPQNNEIHKEPVSSRTYDGLQLNLSASFQWKLESNNIKMLFDHFGSASDIMGNYRDPEKPSIAEAFVRIARASLTESCATFTADDFFANQTHVEQVMMTNLQSAFNQPQKGLVVSIAGLQLRSVDLPDRYEDAISERQRMEQDFDTAMAERDTKSMSMSNLQMQATQKQNELLNTALGKAEQTRLENEAWVDQFLLLQEKQASSYGALLSALNGPNPFQSLFEIMRQRALREHDMAKITLSM